MIKLIHKNYHINQSLSKEECENLHQIINGLGKDQILSAAYNMFTRSQTPLDNNWDNDSDFMKTFLLFYKLAKNLSEDNFKKVLLNNIKTKIDLDEDEKLIFLDKKLLIREGCYLLGFLDSIEDFFEYETTLSSLGYSCDTYEDSEKSKDKKKSA
jgi:hypothetical protein